MSKNNILYILTYPLFLFSQFIPKRSNLWIFGSWGGVKYNDNSKYLFEYVNKNCSDINAVWLTRDKGTLLKIKELGYQCYSMYSLLGIYNTIRAQLAFISQSKTEDIPLYISPKKTRIIQLWHGTPLKKLGADSHAKKQLNKSIKFSILSRIRKLLFPQVGNYYSAFIVSSTEIGNIIYNAYGHIIEPGMIKVTGYPRNDALFSKTNIVTDGSYKGIYLPTFRDTAKDAVDLFDNYGFDLDDINTKLSRNNISLDIKLHPQSIICKDFKRNINTSSNVSLVDFDDLYSELSKYDFLITDYSSVFFDYLLLDRPIIFAAFDLKEYDSMRGMYFNYNEITPGLKVFNWPDVIDAVLHCVEHKSEYMAERRLVSQRVNQYIDDDSCKRVIEMSKNILIPHGH